MVIGVFHKSVIKKVLSNNFWSLMWSRDAAVMAEGGSDVLTTELCIRVRRESA